MFHDCMVSLEKDPGFVFERALAVVWILKPSRHLCCSTISGKSLLAPVGWWWWRREHFGPHLGCMLRRAKQFNPIQVRTTVHELTYLWVPSIIYFLINYLTEATLLVTDAISMLQIFFPSASFNWLANLRNGSFSSHEDIIKPPASDQL